MCFSVSEQIEWLRIVLMWMGKNKGGVKLSESQRALGDYWAKLKTLEG